MLEPVSTLVGLVWLGQAALYPYATRGSAVSEEAKAVGRAASELMESLESSQALFGAKAEAIAELRSFANDCAIEGWDGYGAMPINAVALRRAEDLVRVLPDDFLLPEFAPEPDGSLSLDWIRSGHRLYSLSVGANNRLAFAWIDGSDKGRGVVGFDGFAVPARVLADIERIMSDGDATVRTA